ncbi:hypothetical protein [Salibacterium lacus]|uniref:Uncharacterized protein n=1 Tax=Salibacterium lacus TaxID=1898109 RepID=A0ABW5T5B6_9BACI
MKVETVGSVRDTKNPLPTVKATEKNTFDFKKMNWRTSAWTALISVGIALALSLLSFLLINSAVNDSISLPEGEESAISMATNQFTHSLETEFDVTIPNPQDIIGFFGYFVLSHMSSPELVVDGTGYIMGEGSPVEGQVSFNHGILAFLWIPFTALFIGGMYLGRRTANLNNMDRLQYAGLSSLLYAIVPAFISLFAGFQYSIGTEATATAMYGSITLHYSFFSTLIFAFLLGMIPLMFGLLTQAVRDRKSIGYSHYFYKAVTTGTGLIISLSVVAFFIMLFGDIFEKWGIHNDFTWLMTIILFFVLACQLGFTILSLLHFGSMKVVNTQTQTADSYSLFGGTIKDEYLHQALMNFNFYTNIEFYLQMFIFLPILVFLYAGYRLSKRSGTTIQPVLLFSLIYSVFIAIIAVLGTNSFEFMFHNFEGRSEVFENTIKINVPFFRLFILSFIFSSVVTYAGTWIRTVFHKSS